jgi:hypothetical protein
MYKSHSPTTVCYSPPSASNQLHAAVFSVNTLVARLSKSKNWKKSRDRPAVVRLSKSKNCKKSRDRPAVARLSKSKNCKKSRDRPTVARLSRSKNCRKSRDRPAVARLSDSKNWKKSRERPRVARLSKSKKCTPVWRTDIGRRRRWQDGWVKGSCVTWTRRWVYLHDHDDDELL